MNKRVVAIYARVSTEHEAQLSALENQIQYYADILSRHPEWEVYDRYIDEGITGTSVKKRKNFLRMIEDAQAGKFDLIITREVSRFARNTVVTLEETRKLKKIGVEVWFTEDNIWTMNDEDGELRLTIMASLAQNESKKTSMRVKAGQMVSFQNGVPYGNGNILGYDKLPNHGGYVINPEQAETVKMIFDFYESGMGEKAISYKLEQLGRKTSTGKTNWQCSSIGRMLKNSFYCGIVKYRKQYVPDFLEQKKINNKGEVDFVFVEGKHEPIISREQFEHVQSMLAEKRMVYKEHMTGYKPSDCVWVRKMVCGQCGRHFNRKITHRLKGEAQYSYQCYNVVKNGTIRVREKKGLPIDGICTIPMIPEWKIEMMASMIFSKFFSEREVIIEIANNLLERNFSLDIDNRDEERKMQLENKKRKVEQQMENLLDLRLSDVITKEQYINKNESLEKDLKSIIIEIEEISLREPISEDCVQNKIAELKLLLKSEYLVNSNAIPEYITEAFVEKIVVTDTTTFDWYLNISDYKFECSVTGVLKKKTPQITDINGIEVEKNFLGNMQHRLLSQTNSISKVC